ncbi:MAG: OsmC family protein [Saprospiraceae bacterium]|nr:OsmC family protein [Lewinellaceae bacterium]
MNTKDLKVAARYLANNLKLRKSKSEVYLRHQTLKKIYDEQPEKAMIVDAAVVEGKHLDDPFRSEVHLNPELNVPLKTGLHRAVGGDHDFANPGDILCAALATCFESTMRMIANRLEVELTHTKVEVQANVDVRGTLMFDKSVPVGFQSMHLNVEIGAKNISENMVNTLFNATKRSCVVYQTLKPGIPISKSVKMVG